MQARPLLVSLAVIATLRLAYGGLRSLPERTGARQEAVRAAPTRVGGLEDLNHLSVDELMKELRQMRHNSPSFPSGPRSRRQDIPGDPVVEGTHHFENDGHTRALIHYSGNASNVIFVLTYDFAGGLPTDTNLYRSVDYGRTFTDLVNQLDPDVPDPLLWPRFYVSPNDRDMVVIPHSQEAKFYYTLDEGDTWHVQEFNSTTIDAQSLLWHPTEDKWIIGHDRRNDHLYVTQDFGQTWSKVADYVRSPSDYQWGVPGFDSEPSVVYFNTYDPNSPDGDITVDLYTQRHPYTPAQQREFDPALGKHDGFLIVGPYIFAQKTSDKGVVRLLVSHNRQRFQEAKIPSNDPHEGYLVTHINSLQALVIVQHTSSQFNLYLSNAAGVYFSLSLQDLVVDAASYSVDLEVIEGVNGTLVANQYVRVDASKQGSPMRTLISLDNGAEWELVRPPAEGVGESPLLCEPPLCSLHFHMGTSEFARLGVYSQESAPGIIVAHGNTGEELAENPDLYISRDGGITWEETLSDSWGVSVLDHGGLMVAARDYHQEPSRELKYTCNEGLSWREYIFSEEDMFVFGVLTEPGEHTTVVSLYGIESKALQTQITDWVVITVNFSSIFPRVCGDEDYIKWSPWDERLDGEDCMLGSSITIERRKVDVCCLNGHEYDREFNFEICTCAEEDYECDYGYKRVNGLNGPCVEDPDVSIPDPCEGKEDNSPYKQSRGYRKISGDVCVDGVEEELAPFAATCCGGGSPEQTSSSDEGANAPAIVLGVFLLVAIVIAGVLCIGVIVLCTKNSSLRQRYTRVPIEPMERFSFQEGSSSESEAHLPPPYSPDEDDDDPVAL